MKTDKTNTGYTPSQAIKNSRIRPVIQTEKEEKEVKKSVKKKKQSSTDEASVI